MGRGVAPTALPPGILKGPGIRDQGAGYPPLTPVPYSQVLEKWQAVSSALRNPQCREMGSQAVRPISTTWLNALLRLHRWPIYAVIYSGPSRPRYCYRVQGDLILGGASRLDAFSSYPCHTWLPSYALGRTAGTPEVCSTRSSRTVVNFTQISCAHDG